MWVLSPCDLQRASSYITSMDCSPAHQVAPALEPSYSFLRKIQGKNQMMSICWAPGLFQMHSFIQVSQQFYQGHPIIIPGSWMRNWEWGGLCKVQGHIVDKQENQVNPNTVELQVPHSTLPSYTLMLAHVHLGRNYWVCFYRGKSWISPLASLVLKWVFKKSLHVEVTWPDNTLFFCH